MVHKMIKVTTEEWVDPTELEKQKLSKVQKKLEEEDDEEKEEGDIFDDMDKSLDADLKSWGKLDKKPKEDMRALGD